MTAPVVSIILFPFWNAILFFDRHQGILKVVKENTNEKLRDHKNLRPENSQECVDKKKAPVQMCSSLQTLA